MANVMGRFGDAEKQDMKQDLLVVDYYSRCVEVLTFPPTRSTGVIVHMKSIFTHHGVAETLITDSGPQFSGH